MEAFGKEYEYWVERINTDPDSAGLELLQAANTTRGSGRDNRKESIYQLEGIVADDPEFWQLGSESKRDALSFWLTNSVLSRSRMSVIKS